MYHYKSSKQALLHIFTFAWKILTPSSIFCFFPHEALFCLMQFRYWHSSLSLPLSYDVVFMSAAFDYFQVETASTNHCSKNHVFFFMKEHLFYQNLCFTALVNRSYDTCEAEYDFVLSALGSLYVQGMRSLLFPVWPLINLYRLHPVCSMLVIPCF